MEQIDRIEVILLRIDSRTRDMERRDRADDYSEEMLGALKTLVKMYVRQSFTACITPPCRGTGASRADNAKAKKSEVWKAWDAAVAVIDKVEGRR